MSKIDAVQVGGGAAAQPERELDTIPERLVGQVLCWGGRPQPGESSLKCALAG